MGVIVGIDIGGTNTKIVGIKDGKVFSPVHVKATDPVASLYGAFGRFVCENNLSLSQIEKIMITGVGAAFVTDKIFGISTACVEEFLASGLGGLYISQMEKTLVVSMGTGTAFIAADENGVKHLGGSGVGGGTISGMGKLMIGVSHTADIIELAENGDITQIDLCISDITETSIAMLSPNVTASNFGKVKDLATKEDCAMGILNLVFQTIGMLAVFAAQKTKDQKVVAIGYLATVPQARQIFDAITDIHGIDFIIPKEAEFATAIGAAICYQKGKTFADI